MNKNVTLDPAIGGVITCLEKYLTGAVISVDGTLPLPSREECLGSYIGTYLDVIAERIPINAVYDARGNYERYECDIPSGGIKGIYLVGYEHPITGAASYYIGSTIECLRKRMNMHMRHIMTARVGGKESDTWARVWESRHGRNLDYAFLSYFPMNEEQSLVREVETFVQQHFKSVHGVDNILNREEKGMLTIEKKNPTPPLLGLDF